MKLLKLVPDGTNIKFLRYGTLFYVVSALLTVASIFLLSTKGLNFGVDFVGGEMIRTTFVESEEAPIATLRTDLEKLGYGEPAIQQFGAKNEVSIRLRLPEGENAEQAKALADEMTQRITQEIQSKYPDARIDGVDSVSGKVSGELFVTAAYALLAAMAGISIYIWVRFEWQFGVGALLALFHDVVLALGMFSLFQMEFNLNIVASILTIIGYSLNDNIVVYDRIRENMRKYRKMPMTELLNLSVNETLARTIMTSLSTIAVLVALLLLGPHTLFGFTAAILLGIVVGTYSSIYMAAPILLWLKVTPDSFVPQETAIERQERIARGEA